MPYVSPWWVTCSPFLMWEESTPGLAFPAHLDNCNGS
jgi:hypothetical protein